MIHCPSCEQACDDSAKECPACRHPLAAPSPRVGPALLAALNDTFRTLTNAGCGIICFAATAVLLEARAPVAALQAGFIALMALLVLLRRRR